MELFGLVLSLPLLLLPLPLLMLLMMLLCGTPLSLLPLPSSSTPRDETGHGKPPPLGWSHRLRRSSQPPPLSIKVPPAKSIAAAHAPEGRPGVGSIDQDGKQGDTLSLSIDCINKRSGWMIGWVSSCRRASIVVAALPSQILVMIRSFPLVIQSILGSVSSLSSFRIDAASAWSFFSDCRRLTNRILCGTRTRRKTLHQLSKQVDDPESDLFVWFPRHVRRVTRALLSMFPAFEQMFASPSNWAS
jgi:hypothetical protein